MTGIDPPDRVLLVEGESDVHVVHHLWRRQDGPMPSFRIEEKGTLGKVLDAIGPEIKLEDFVRRMIPTDDRIWPRSEDYVDRIPVPDRRFRPGKILRAKLYSWLATRENPGRMGAAIGAGDLRVDAVLGSTFATWLRSLFA